MEKPHRMGNTRGIARNENPRDPRYNGKHREAAGASASRFLIVLAIAGTGLSAFTMLVFGLIVVMKTIWHAFADAVYDIESAKHLAVELIEMTDLFLLGMVLYVVSLGMYQLFINAELDVPEWMRVDSLDDLKTQLINVIVVLLAVSFLASAMTWTSDRSIIYFGAATGIVILALASYNYVHHWISHVDKDEA